MRNILPSLVIVAVAIGITRIFDNLDLLGNIDCAMGCYAPSPLGVALTAVGLFVMTLGPIALVYWLATKDHR